MDIHKPENLSWVARMNALGKESIPFVFLLDFDLTTPIVWTMDEIPDDVLFKINQFKNYNLSGKIHKSLKFNKLPVQIHEYSISFKKIMDELNYGNTFLINLTFPTEITTNFSLRELFNVSHAKYKLFFKDEFIVSSPESFIQIKNNVIRTFPMKGTIDAGIKNAKKIILNDLKETAEHYTIVDLLRNDLSMVAENVQVKRFRFIDKLNTSNKVLYQVSSEIEGQLEPNYSWRLGDIFAAILPAGSISGAPKKKTVDIIKQNEMLPRGFYTGVFGIFDGKNVDSGVMIRFIEKDGEKMYYRSGCGITHLSDMYSEYCEMIDKVYVPVSRNH